MRRPTSSTALWSWSTAPRAERFGRDVRGAFGLDDRPRLNSFFQNGCEATFGPPSALGFDERPKLSSFFQNGCDAAFGPRSAFAAPFAARFALGSDDRPRLSSFFQKGCDAGLRAGSTGRVSTGTCGRSAVDACPTVADCGFRVGLDDRPRLSSFFQKGWDAGFGAC